MKTLITLAVVAVLSGCMMVPQSAFHSGNPDKQVIRVDDYDIGVVPRGPNQWDAYGHDDSRLIANINMPSLKARQIRAVELVSKCKVTSSEYIPSTWVLQALVTCS